MKADAMNTVHEANLSTARRRWLIGSGSTLAAALGAGTVGNLLSVRPARAADYKALVCIFLYGGNDGMNMVVPNDTMRYDQYSGVRKGLAIPKASLMALGGVNYGLHPAMSALGTAWGEGKLAPVFNVGPLFQPLTKAQYRAAAANSEILPDSLFSHSDQQILWETGSTDSLTRTGWGGRAAETLATVNPVISVAGTARFGLSSVQTPLVLPGPGATFGAYGLQASDTYAPQLARKAAIDALYAQAQEVALADAYTAAQRDAFAMSARLGAIVKTAPGDPGAIAAIDTAFAPITAAGKITSGLGNQLYQLAKLIAGNATVQGNRQLFFASMGGFDTHGNQLVTGRRSRAAAEGAGRRARCVPRRAEGPRPERRGDHLHAERLRPHLRAEQQHRHRPRLGQPAPRARRRGQGRQDLRHLPRTGARRCQRRGARQLGAAGPLDSHHRGRPVRGHAARLVRRHRAAARCGAAEPEELRHGTQARVPVNSHSARRARARAPIRRNS